MTAILIEAFSKSALVLSVALLANLALCKKSADVRRLILSAAVVSLFVAALASAVLPRWKAELPIAPVYEASATLYPIVIDAVANAVPHSQAPAPTPHREMPNPVLILWVAGTTLLLTRFLLALRSLRRLRRSSTHMIEIDGIPILQSETIGAPVTWGILRPVILVPDTFDRLSQESRDAILSHEMAHIQSYDFALRTLAEIARALLWFQPLIWIVRRQLREEQELACDDRVLEAGASASSYAKLLLNWSAGPEIAVGMAHRSCLKKRLYALLDPGLRRNRVPSKIAGAASLLALAAAIPLAALTFSQPVVEPPVIIRAMPVPPPQALRTVPPRPVQLAQNRPAAPAGAPAKLAAPLTAYTTLVVVDVSVIDKTTNRAVEGLGANDFTLTEDGAPQTITLCEFQKLDDTLQIGAPQSNSRDLSSYYVLGYYPSNHNSDSNYRRIVVGLKDSSLAASSKLDYRVGYYVERNSIMRPPAAVTLPAPGVTPPVLTYRTDPEYSTEARKAKYSGTITLSVTVDETGKVTRLSVVRSLGMGLDEKAVDAVRQWKFDPAMQNGKPVTIQTEVTVNFRLL